MFMDRNGERVGQSWRRKEFLADGPEIESLKFASQFHKPNPMNAKFVSTEERSGILPFRKWEELVEQKLSLFLLPKNLQSELLEMVRTVTIEIDRWIKDLSLILSEPLEIAHSGLCYFQWTSLGRINRQETARNIIMNVRSYKSDLCILAEHYDLKDDMGIEKDTITKELAKYLNFNRMVLYRKYWTTAAGENDRYSDPQGSFKRSLLSYLNGHCLQYPDLLLGLSQLTDPERSEFYKKGSFLLLLFFLDWPLQRQFLKASELLLPFLKTNEFHAILRIILYDRILLGRKDFKYIGLLKEFWHQSSSELKEFIEDKSIYEPLMFTVNYPNEETFPNEKLFESNFNNRLTFQYQGVKYSLFRTDRIYRNYRYNFFELTRPRYIEEVSYISQKRKHEDLNPDQPGKVKNSTAWNGQPRYTMGCRAIEEERKIVANS
ncbi:uncharacterized protein TNIN_52271 [Trichonephila inaurata madagascariensis]|uniref:Uncharacterized protein n=1 Tax=Trichonephila inaurata madagascariensis TaxID=2747483 RepID=A0A8X6M9T2_9ARAC|nr:uncharacterized protein TNIN_52271 [Trichonephila inaurata madagascariensis]